MGKADSVASETIVIEDTPIISINGDNGDPPETATGGTATVKWIKPDDVTSYSIRWKELGIDRSGKLHTDPTWKMDKASVPPDFGGTYTIPTPSQTSYEIQNLDLDRLYGVQLNYTRSTEDGEERVFAARDFHVYPSTHAAGGGERIASAPLRRLQPDKEYKYAVCTGTFPGDPARWRAYIEHALEQWEIATDGLIKTTPALDDIGGHQECADFAQFVDPIATELAAYVIDRQMEGANPNETEITARARLLVQNFNESAKNAGLLRKARAEDPGIGEVLMIDDRITDDARFHQAFSELAKEVGRRHCLQPNQEVVAPGCAISSRAILDGQRVLVDLLFSRHYLLSDIPDITENHFPGGDRTPNRGDIQFNSCEGTHPIYPVIVHEAGHALGITGGTDIKDPRKERPLLQSNRRSNAEQRDQARLLPTPFGHSRNLRPVPSKPRTKHSEMMLRILLFSTLALAGSLACEAAPTGSDTSPQPRETAAPATQVDQRNNHANVRSQTGGLPGTDRNEGQQGNLRPSHPETHTRPAGPGIHGHKDLRGSHKLSQLRLRRPLWPTS